MTHSKFQPNRITLSFGVISDWHIRETKPAMDNRQKLISAVTQLQQAAAEQDPRGLALLIAAGDLTHDGKPSEIAMVRQTLEQAMDLNRIPLLYVAGNHDRHNPDCNADYRRVFGEELDRLYEAQDAAPDGLLSGNRHVVVGGKHFITLDPGRYSKTVSNTFSPSTKRWLDSTLRTITSREPNAYVYVITHLLIWDTCYGSTRGVFYATDDLTPILRQYPQVVTFGGHLHFPLNDERAIMQTSFTSMETATLSDMLIDGFDCGNVRKGTKTEDNRDFAQGLLVQVDADENVRITRMDFRNHAEIGEPWVLDAPSPDGAHLRRYTVDRRLDAARKPIRMDGEIAVRVRDAEDGSRERILCFAAARYDGWVRRYTVSLTDAAGVERKLTYLTDFYRYPQPEQMPGEVVLPLSDLPAGRYTVAITAQDCWGNAGAPLCGAVELA